jgi:hypothetical protein
VLLHELAHLRRRDPLTNGLLVLAQSVHWFNPLARFAVARCRAERELACDAVVMAAGAAAAPDRASSPTPEAYGRPCCASPRRSSPPTACPPPRWG